MASTPEPSRHTIGDEDISSQVATGADDREVGDEDVHMRGNQDSLHEDQPFVATQASQAAGDIREVVKEILGDFTDARPQPGPATGPGEGGTAGADPAAEEVIHL